MTTTRWEVHWQTGDRDRMLDTADHETARGVFQDCLNARLPCKLVRVERSEEIEAAWEWRE